MKCQIDIESYLKGKLLKCYMPAKYQDERICKSCIQNVGKIDGKVICCKELDKG